MPTRASLKQTATPGPAPGPVGDPIVTEMKRWVGQAEATTQVREASNEKIEKRVSVIEGEVKRSDRRIVTGVKTLQNEMDKLMEMQITWMQELPKTLEKTLQQTLLQTLEQTLQKTHVEHKLLATEVRKMRKAVESASGSTQPAGHNQQDTTRRYAADQHSVVSDLLTHTADATRQRMTHTADATRQRMMRGGTESEINVHIGSANDKRHSLSQS